MKIKEVIYQRLFNLANFNNEKIGFTAEIAENDSEDQVMAELFFKVLKIERTFEKYRLLETELEVTKSELRELKSRLSWAFERLAQLEAERAEIDQDERKRCRVFDIEEQIKREIENIERIKGQISRKAEKHNRIIDKLKILEDAIKAGNFDEVGDFEKIEAEEVINSAKVDAMLKGDA
jgi:hypothetical protein